MCPQHTQWPCSLPLSRQQHHLLGEPTVQSEAALAENSLLPCLQLPLTHPHSFLSLVFLRQSFPNEKLSWGWARRRRPRWAQQSSHWNEDFRAGPERGEARLRGRAQSVRRLGQRCIIGTHTPRQHCSTQAGAGSSPGPKVPTWSLSCARQTCLAQGRVGGVTGWGGSSRRADPGRGTLLLDPIQDLVPGPRGPDSGFTACSDLHPDFTRADLMKPLGRQEPPTG